MPVESHARPVSAPHPAARTASVLRQACAWILVLLVTLPFTAPFSTFDASLLFVASTAAGQPATADAPPAWSFVAPYTASAGPVLDEEALSHAVVVEAVAVAYHGGHCRTLTVRDLRTSAVRRPLLSLRL
jgi:hypothetical protein